MPCRFEEPCEFHMPINDFEDDCRICGHERKAHPTKLTTEREWLQLKRVITERDDAEERKR